MVTIYHLKSPTTINGSKWFNFGDTFLWRYRSEEISPEADEGLALMHQGLSSCNSPWGKLLGKAHYWVCSARCPLSLLLISLIKRSNHFATCHKFLSVKLKVMQERNPCEQHLGIKTRFINKSSVYYGKLLVCKKSTTRSNYMVLRASWIPVGHLRQHIVRPHRRCRSAQDSNLQHLHIQEHLPRCTHPLSIEGDLRVKIWCERFLTCVCLYTWQDR